MAVKNKKSAERKFGVLLEKVDSNIERLVDGHVALDKKIDKNHQEFKEFTSEVNYKFGVVFEKFNEIDKQFDKVDKQFGDVKDELHVIRNELKEKVGRDEFVLLEKRAPH